ncbi:hypothetical protein BOTBODRAFT_114091, partial [Botryobasidium botryosum FD-172 SS1]
ERQREANIAQTRALLDELNLKEAASALGLSSADDGGATAPKAKPVQPRETKPRIKAELPRRQSSRIHKASIPLNETPAERKKREEARREKEEEERIENERLAREAKKPRHGDLPMKTTGDEMSERELASLRTSLETLCRVKNPRRVGSEAYEDGDEAEDERDEKKEEVKEALANLRVASRAKVTKDRIYSGAYHPDVTKDLIFFGDKHGQLGIWDALAPPDEKGDDNSDDDAKSKTENQEGGKYWRLQPHWPPTSRSSISCVKMDPIDAHSVFTSSYDCTLRHMSFTSGQSTEIFHLDGILISSFDFPSTGNEVWVSDTQGGVSHVDMRVDRRHNARRWCLNKKDKIGCVSVNPVTNHVLLTASNDRTLKLWDARKLSHIPLNGDDAGGLREADHTTMLEAIAGDGKTKGKKKDALLRAEFEHGMSVTSAYWDPSGRRIVSTCYDNRLRLWTLDRPTIAASSPLATFSPRASVRHNCDTGKWVTLFRAHWHPNPDVYPHFVVANMDHSINIYSHGGEALGRLADPQRITAVQAVALSHPTNLARIASGNGSGRCVLWAPGDDQSQFV